jgi:hypothetical protein
VKAALNAVETWRRRSAPCRSRSWNSLGMSSDAPVDSLSPTPGICSKSDFPPADLRAEERMPGCRARAAFRFQRRFGKS